MPIDLYLAMTDAEMAACAQMPAKVGWMACHFSPSGPGLSNLPKALPPRSILILDDHLPFQDHRAEIISEQLTNIAAMFDIRGVLLDFQRDVTPEVQNLVAGLVTELPCPVAAPPAYAAKGAPVFLPPCPPNRRLADYLLPYKNREIWLEIAKDKLEICVTEKGCSMAACTGECTGHFPHKDENLHCHYRIDQKTHKITFTLQRSMEDLQDLMDEAGRLGVNTAVGLWQELKK